MHEMSIALSLLETAEEKACELGLSDVVAIHLQVGPLAGVVPECLESAFEMASVGTRWEKCRLAIETTALTGRCPKCRLDRAITSINQICCADCGTPIHDIVGGQELNLVALEVCDDGVPSTTG